MINPVEYNFQLYVGQTLKYPFTVWNDEAQTIPYSFTDHTVSSQARINYASSQAVNLNPSIVGNTIFLNATPAQLAAFNIPSNEKSVKYVYDIEVTKPDNSKWTIVRGIIEIFPEVTKL